MSETSSSSLPRTRMVGMVLSLRAARSLLGWSQKDLAKRAGVSVPALNRVERFSAEPRLETMLKLEAAFTDAGIDIKRRGDGGFEIQIRPEVIDEISGRIDAGEAMTSRGRVGGNSSMAQSDGRKEKASRQGQSKKS